MAATGKQVMTKVTTAIWQHILETWKLCNMHFHQNADQLSLPNYQQAMTMLYELSHQLPQAAQATLYKQPLETILEQPAPKLQTW